MRLVRFFFASFVLMASSNVQAFDWRDLWSTPEQRAAKNLEQEDFDKLVQEAPNAAWQGIGEYRKGDYKAASESFSKQHEQALANGSTPEMVSSQYNRANAEVLAGNYEQALNLYDEVLELEPEHEDAKHNYEIAKQLWKQQQQQNNQQDGEQQDSDSDDQQQGQQQDQQQGQQQNQQGQPQDQQQQNNQSSDQQQSAGQSGQQESQNMDQSSAESQQAEEQKAAEAMQAERDKQNEDQHSQSNQFTDQQTNDGASSGANNQLTEQEQATEQWLRQIPDDPAGLLQRKLQNRHMTDYPEVRDSAKPW